MNNSNPQPVERRFVITFIAVVIGAAAFLYFLGTTNPHPNVSQQQAEKTIAESYDNPLRYDQLVNLLEDPKQVKQIETAKIDSLTGKTVLEFEDQSTTVVNYPPDKVSQLGNQLTAAGVSNQFIAEEPQDSGGFNWRTLFIMILVGLGVVLFLRFISRKAGHPGNHPLAKNDALLQQSKPGDVSFADVAGCDEAVLEVSECLDFLRNPASFYRVGAKMPAGIILYGPPGTGKTMLAKALANEANVPFFDASGSDFVQMFVGVGASRMRELFAKAEESPDGAIIFIDEIDALGGKRNSGVGGSSNEERENTLNQFLTCLDGFKERDRVVVIGATNRLDMLDPALIRPGRLSRQIPIPLPNQKGRQEILEVHCKNKPLEDDVDLEQLAMITAGSSGADLADMVNEAAILAARDKRTKISQADLSEGHLRAIAGPRRADDSTSKDEEEIIAFHEAGHVLAAELCATHEKANRVEIRQRGKGSGGLALYGQNDRFLHSTRYFHERMVCALGGRAAEQVIFGMVSSGAANDLQQANKIARTAVDELGFSPASGQFVHDPYVQSSDYTRQVSDQEIARLVDEAYQEAVTLLSKYEVPLRSLANALLQKKDLGREEIVAAIGIDLSEPQVSSGTMGVRQPVAVEEEIILPEPETWVKRSQRYASGLRSRLKRKKQPSLNPSPVYPSKNKSNHKKPSTS